MKIIIIGAGISGLATYHALRKYAPSVQIQIYEAHHHPSPASPGSDKNETSSSSLSNPNSNSDSDSDSDSNSSNLIIGGGLGLAPNGLRALDVISPSAAKYIQQRGFECGEFVFRNQKGRKLGRMRIGGQNRYGFGEMMVARAVVHESLLFGIEEEEEENKEKTEKVVNWGRKVKEVKEREDGVDVMFEDGATESCDLVVGADGAWSKCREAIFGEEYQPQYDGLTGIGGFLPLASLSNALQEGLKVEPVTMTFSRSGFFGYSMCSNPSLPLEEQYVQWWSTYEASTPLSRDTPAQEVRTQLLNRHGMWKSPYDTPGSPASNVFLQIINSACDQMSSKKDGGRSSKWLILPRFMTPRLPFWTSLHGVSVDGRGPVEGSKGRGPVEGSKGHGRIVLVGDARSTMPPDSGQGVSCAIEDALTLALLLKHFVGPKVKDDALDKLLAESAPGVMTPAMDAEALRKLAKAYEDIRVPRVKKILRLSKRSGDEKREIGFLEEKIRNLVLFIFSYCLPDSIHDGTFGYDVQVGVDRYLAKQEWRW
ncbi:FAD/NAD(P)-binding domain-containing protein [Dendrothele bispora CBS 962.96]|uniref:FAD/NAD(P)-binding domain-containing protein n=1 Tax=Dendrothele bispora (strain CBS 962.96) TaxID=1314807 RepID=A0A4S8MVH9_DENBC|nr:FAD/NAD(P)-binding domain-containing protein [Dendrothele bispora CBS 962.96]